MKKKIVFGLIGVVALVAGVAGMAAYEAHVINVTAHIENALDVHPDEIAFGTVFPQEYVERQFTVEMSTSFQAAERVDDIEYVIKQKPKCECTEDGAKENLCEEGDHAAVDYATHLCPDGFAEMENLCQFLSKNDADLSDGNDTSHPSYFVPAGAEPAHCIGQPERQYGNVLVYSSTGWAGHSCPAGMKVVDGGVIGDTEPIAAQGPAKYGTSVDGFDYPVYPHYTYNGGSNTPGGEEGWVVHNGQTGQTMQIWVDCITPNPDATGRLSKDEGDLLDLWTVDLKVPPVEGFVGQDWPAGCPTVPTNDVDYGCDLWIEVTCISEEPGDCRPE